MNKSEIYESINSNKNGLEISQIEQILDTIEKEYGSITQKISIESLQRFLYDNILRFNRFSVPTPFVLEKKSKEFFMRFLEIFNKTENSNINVASFNMCKLLWNTFDLIKENSNAEEFKGILKARRKINTPDHPNKVDEFNEYKNKLESYLSGYLNSTLLTKIRTSIPVSPVLSKTVVNTKYKNRNLKIVFNPNFFDSGQTFVQTAGNNVNIPLGSSQWQNSVCNIEFYLDGLFDPIEAVPPLTISYGEQLPFETWPSIFTEVFYIIENISWQIYDSKSKIGKWLLSPSDLGSITWEVEANTISFESITKSPPVLSFLTSPSPNTTEIELKSIDSEISWYSKCLKIAQNKLNQGETNEALFWLNIGIEALFQEKSLLMLETKNLTYEHLNSGRSYWITAQELVFSQFPETAKNIEWPESIEGVPSWFSKIKYLDKEIGFSVNKKEIISKFIKINKHRNSLFHGSTESRVNSSVVETAIECYLWLIDNFK